MTERPAGIPLPIPLPARPNGREAEEIRLNRGWMDLNAVAGICRQASTIAYGKARDGHVLSFAEALECALMCRGDASGDAELLEEFAQAVRDIRMARVLEHEERRAILFKESGELALDEDLDLEDVPKRWVRAKEKQAR